MREDFLFGHRHRAQRGDLEPLILRLLCDKPMHGYEIIRTLEERSHGFWRPSPGSVYPILQFLEEKDLVSSQEIQGKKVYAITDRGRDKVNQSPDPEEPHPFSAKLRAGLRFRDMQTLIHDSAQFMKEVAVRGSDKDMKAVKNILQEAHDKLKAVVKEMDTHA